MALQLTQEQASGISGNYWKIDSVRLGKNDSFCECIVTLYKDSDASAAAKLPLTSKVFLWSGADNPCPLATLDLVDQNPFQLCYNKLKTLDEFDGALDV